MLLAVGINEKAYLPDKNLDKILNTCVLSLIHNIEYLIKLKNENLALYMI